MWLPVDAAGGEGPASYCTARWLLDEEQQVTWTRRREEAEEAAEEEEEEAAAEETDVCQHTTS